eukprot:6305388-Pyramimonas_sp.AAC.1
MTLDGFVDTTAGMQEGDLVGLVLHATPFYAEQGGQVFDTGAICTAAGAELLQVEGVQVGRACAMTVLFIIQSFTTTSKDGSYVGPT